MSKEAVNIFISTILEGRSECTEARENQLDPNTKNNILTRAAKFNSSQLFATEVKFPLTSLGYLGWFNSESTLISSFFSIFWPNGTEFPNLKASRIHFPQRIPRVGFFEELLYVELDSFKNEFLNRQSLIKEQVSKVFREEPISNKLEAVNLIALAARYGVYSFLDFEESIFKSQLNSDIDFELLRNFLIGKISYCVSHDLEIPLKQIQNLLIAAESSSAIDLLTKARVICLLIVSISRHAGSDCELDLDFLNSQAKWLYNFIDAIRLNPNDPGLISLSVLWRGLAMWSQFSESEISDCLDRSLQCAHAFRATDLTSNLLRSENIITLYQTFSKWAGRADAKIKLQYLQEMQDLDQFDSTSFSEIGLTHFKSKDFSKALSNFKSATELGPPGLGLNWYFKGECELELKNLSDAEASFITAATIDPLALSPHLSLLKLYQLTSQNLKASKIKLTIENDDPLRSQLTPEELNALQIT